MSASPSLPHHPGPALLRLFLGSSPYWYKLTILCLLALNPVAWLVVSKASPEVHVPVAELSWPKDHPPASGTRVKVSGEGVDGEVTVLDGSLLRRTARHGEHIVLVDLAKPATVPMALVVHLPAGEQVTVRLVEHHGQLAVAGGARDAGFIVGWMMLAEFIFTLAMALSCYPLLPGGLLVMEALLLGLCAPERMYEEAHHNFPVILLLVFVVAGVNFLKEWLSVVFTAILFSTRSKVVLSLLFVLAGAVLSAFLDALTVTAVVIAVCKGFYDVYHAYRSQAGDHDEQDLERFRAFLRSLVMHAVVGTALGGVCTMVGEPQNLLIAHVMQEHLPAERGATWGFGGFIKHMAIITMPTLVVGLLTTVLCEKLRLCGHGALMPDKVREVLLAEAVKSRAARTPLDRLRLNLQGACALLLVAGLAFHWAEVGILGLFLIVLATALTGVNDEHRIGHAFTESLPFTALLVVFFGVVGMIAQQDLFRPVIDLALARDARGQMIAFFCANAALSAISDNVFVATVFINEATAAFEAGRIGAEQYEKLAIATNTGTNIPSIATPNGQAAFLFLLTSALAAPIRLGYGRMLLMALPYTVTMTAIALAMVWFFL